MDYFIPETNSDLLVTLFAKANPNFDYSITLNLYVFMK